jgi:hypothetical protein
MAALSIQDVSRRSGLSAPTLRYYDAETDANLRVQDMIPSLKALVLR